MHKNLEEYLLDNYGLCKLGDECDCIQPIKRTSPVSFNPWLGRLCPNWQSIIPAELLAALPND